MHMELNILLICRNRGFGPTLNSQSALLAHHEYIKWKFSKLTHTPFAHGFAWSTLSGVKNINQ